MISLNSNFSRISYFTKVALSLSLSLVSLGFALLIPNPAACQTSQDPRVIPKEQNFVFMSQGLATITAQKFALPKDTSQFPLAGLVAFPYYQASPELKDFIDNNKIAGWVPMSALNSISPQYFHTLPPTDTVRIGTNLPFSVNLHKKRLRETQLAHKNVLKDEIPWLVAHEDGQAFQLPQDPETIVMTSPGSIFNIFSKGHIALRCGTMWIFNGSHITYVDTKSGELEIKPHSFCAIEQTWFNQLRVANLSGQNAHLKFTAKSNNENKTETLAIEKGHEFSFSDAKIATVGVSDFISPKVPTSLSSTNFATKKLDPDASKFITELKSLRPPFNNMRMLSQYERMLKELGITPAMRKAEIRNKTLKNAGLTSPTPIYKASLDSRYFVPVQKPVIQKNTPQIFPKSASQLKTTWLQKGYIKYLDDEHFTLSQMGDLSINEGEILVFSKSPMRIHAGECIIELKEDTIALISKKENLIVLRNLLEKHARSIFLKVNGRSIYASAGSEIILGQSILQINQTMKHDGIARREHRTIETGSGSIVINKCEFSHTSLMQYSPLLCQLQRSSNSADKDLFADLVKMNACLSIMGSNKGSYRPVSSGI